MGKWRPSPINYKEDLKAYYRSGLPLDELQLAAMDESVDKMSNKKAAKILNQLETADIKEVLEKMPAIVDEVEAALREYTNQDKKEEGSMSKKIVAIDVVKEDLLEYFRKEWALSDTDFLMLKKAIATSNLSNAQMTKNLANLKKIWGEMMATGFRFTVIISKKK